MEKKTTFHWNKKQAWTHAIRSEDNTALKKRLLWCLIGIPIIAVFFFILMLLSASYFDDFTVIVLILGALGIVADIYYMVYLYLKHLHDIDENRCRYTELTITNGMCLLYEKHKHFIREQGFELADLERIDYYSESKQIVFFAPVHHYQPKKKKSNVRLIYLDTDWCFTENLFKEDLLGYFDNLNIPINYIESGYFIENRKELIDIFQARHLELVKSHEHIFEQDPQKTDEMMNQTLGSRTVKAFEIIGAVISIICLFVMPILAALFVGIIIIIAILNTIKKNENVKKHIAPINCKVTVNTYSGVLSSSCTNSNTGHTSKDLILLSDIVKIHYVIKSRKLIIYVKNGGKSIFASIESVIIDNIFTPDLVEFLDQNVMSVTYKRGIFAWGGLQAYGHFKDDH